MDPTRTSTRRLAALTAAAALTVGLVLAGCDSNDTSPPASTSPATSAEVPTTAQSGAHNAADVAFAQQMIPHHRQAVVMSQMARSQAGTQDVKDLAEQIEKAQEPEIRTMTGWLKAWGEEVPEGMHDMHDPGGGDPNGTMPGMMSDRQMTDLDRASGRTFDTMFLTMMIEHHEGAIDMAEAEKQHGAYGPAKGLADRIIKTQTAEITDMREMLQGN
ncbi:lipoprotein [Streptomyces venezuelae]|uniref:DUF305 domain-containing protein n=1 Tax=Streptomyces gardneri TaxID=66892 RepID=UPI0006BC4683|nr:DUF305 domain-containing protein [Streptomyces gardneri]ALO12495.1 lipoprotein [Streptomyces venezuelae]QPK49258.1 DUF305 domain-containing protein [Streptomyces gardneri]WRK40773.1 DUF305 domain-containing protein [Streptomyces venezuelae]CUM36877.1 protein of unknown function DUF305 [Streptomyces venezuelae]